VFLPQSSSALDAEDLGGLVGFTIAAYTTVRGDYAGAAPRTPIALDNGMVFEFSTGFSSYSYRPRAIVFAKKPSDKESGKSGNASGSPVVYKVLIEDRLYDGRRVR
jgi:hypothetical protein